MDKNAIKKYAVWARRELISRVSQKALQYGITEEDIVPANATSINGVVLSADEMKQRKALIDQINAKDYEQVMEEVAYTWFNRFIALRFMEVNGYLPSRVRVFTDENNAFNPQILTEAISLEMPGLDMEKVYAYKDANDNDGLFKYLLIVQCNALSPILPKMFQRISDYTELLFPDNLLREGSAIERMISMIPEEDWKDAVQIIGWLYQYYNSEKKDEVFAALKKNVKITKENIPAATQLFTPDWIVRYMVENSLGRLWVEHNAASAVDEYDERPGDVNELLLSNWKYYVFEAEQEPEVKVQLAEIRKSYKNIKPEDIKAIDPCAGSGHILAYMFDVLIPIYETYGYTTREAVRSIIENNIYGLDIDDRAAQLAYFAVMMKGCQYDRRFLVRKDEDGAPDVPQPHVYAIVESNGLDSNVVDYFTNSDPKLQKDFGVLCEELHNAKEYGSILSVSPVDFAALYARVDEVRHDISMFRDMALDSVLPLIQVAEALAQKYDVVVTNPPYMGGSGMSARLADYAKKFYPDSKSDLFAVFIERCGQMAKKNSYQAMITQHSWMFLSSFEKLRAKLLTVDIVNMAHLGARAFEEIGGEVVQTTSFVIRKSHVADYKGEYCRLIEPTTQQGKEDMFLAGENRYAADQTNFSKIPGSPLAYWVSARGTDNYVTMLLLGSVATTKQGFKTGNNDLFLRLWFEVVWSKISLTGKNTSKKWFPCNKGGSFRKWFGNQEYLVNWENDGESICNYRDEKGKLLSRPQNIAYNFREGLTWSSISSGPISVRYTGEEMMFESKGSGCFTEEAYDLFTLQGFLNSTVGMYYIEALAPTLDYSEGALLKLPYGVTKSDVVHGIVENCIRNCKKDWDSFETSWDFIEHPLVALAHKTTYRANGTVSYRIEDAYSWWQNECDTRFAQLKANEEELNRIFIDIYGLQDELTPEVEDKDVTVRKADLQRDIRSLISYAVGCMFGRYSLDVDGLAYAGGDWDEIYRRDRLADGNAITFGGVNLAVSKDFSQVKVDGEWKDCTFPVDADNIIPICDDEYFDDDVVGRFIRFIEVVYGKDTLQENLRFIADALGGSGQPKDVIRNYFLNDFYADHLKIYQKRPIYWLFDSGKKGGFKALVYMHRYQPDTVARMRTDYVHEQQARYRTAIADLEQRIASASTSERVKLNKRLKKLQEQATEIQGYEEKIHHLADQYIAIDLDDGVKVNYAKFQDVLAKIK